MNNLKDLKVYVQALSGYGKLLILEYIKEAEIDIKMNPKTPKKTLLELQDNINNLCISESDKPLFWEVKSHLDNLISNLK